MASALSATYLPGSATSAPSVLLRGTGLPVLTPDYTSTFVTTDDGWTGSSGTFILNPTEGAPANTLELQGADLVTSTFSRTVTGLTTGQRYAFTLMAQANRGSISVGVSGKTFSAFTTLLSRGALTYPFTASATSQVIQVKVKPPTGSNVNGNYFIDTVQVIRTSNWEGTTVRRSDANGTDVVVREPPEGLDAVGTDGAGTYTLTDYEPALVGLVEYTLTDGDGDTTTALLGAQGTPGVWLTLPATAWGVPGKFDLIKDKLHGGPGTPSSPLIPRFAPATMVLTTSETSDTNGSIHKIVGRADPLVNAGPLAYRNGTMDVFCQDYDEADAIRSLLANGDVALLRQGDFPGMDLYFVTTSLTVRSQQPTPSQRWVASITFQEVVAP